MSRTDYLRFAVIGIVAVIALSMTHSYWGNPYSRMVMKTVESFIPSQASDNVRRFDAVGDRRSE